MNPIYSLFFVISLFAGTSVFAQETKPDKKTKEALAQRYAEDKYYAEFKRGIYNREAWKASWVGEKLSTLYKSWGAPTRTATDETGGQVVVYENVTNTSGGSYTPGYIETATNGFGQTVITGQRSAEDTRWSSQYVTITTVYVDKNGVITKVDFNSKYSRN
ncbi:hypothetical protein ACTJJ0_33330 [Chitinophaga sp. 22321]|uniref:SnoaL-like domain-containing protein n=1 Tax=Chitinophaga hostae TaxID=2831022 RepID=A0ABS5J9W6_9BACT|nr:hypothetical protein [Chitinophaga hostae]MBS0031994.1 hypothetical protein [Chitinophaga hostae]